MKKILTTNLLILIFLFLCIGLNAQNNKPVAALNHIALYVVDLQKSDNFYEKVIGLDTIPEPFHDGKHIWLRIGVNSHLHIIQGAEMPKEYFKGNHICFSVQSVEAFIEKLKIKAMDWEDWVGNKNSVTHRADGIKQIWLRDPDGYWIEINDAKD